MKRILRFLAAPLAAALLLAGMPSAAMLSKIRSYLPFEDVRETDWYYESVKNAYEYGLIKGKSALCYDPAGNLTLAESVVLACQLRSLFCGDGASFSGGSPWYQPYVDYATANGILQPGLYDDYSVRTTRAIFATLLAKALPESELPAINTVSELPDVPTDAVCHPYVLRLYRAGVLTGNDRYGTFHPDSTIRRSEAAAILVRMADPARRMTVTLETAHEDEYLAAGGLRLHLGMSADSLPATMETLPARDGFTYYFFGTDTYENFFAAGVRDGRVVALFAEGKGFAYRDVAAGGLGEVPAAGHCKATVSVDEGDGGRLHGVRLRDKTLTRSQTDTAQTLYGESRMIFHLVNAYRVYRGVEPLLWSDAAETSARLHSQDMVDRNYFAHDSVDGRKSWDRMTEQGILYHFAAENIANGYVDAYDAVAAWINSAAHCENMINSDYTHSGVGIAANDTGKLLFTQDFFG